MQSTAARWREFKSRLTNVYIVPCLDQPEMLKYPPQDYKFINADHWMQFVTERTKLAFLELRKTQQARRRMNKYPHRLSRKGYVGLVVELKAKAEPTQAELEEASTISSEDELYDRCETWVAARVTKEGKFSDEETQKKAEEIIELKEKVSTGATSLSGYNDVLEKALGKEHGGRVRRVAGFVNPTTYFHLLRRNSRQSIEEIIKISLEKVLAE